jgi:hypothetical protein
MPCEILPRKEDPGWARDRLTSKEFLGAHGKSMKIGGKFPEVY